jgi:hypothetical protein
MGLAKLEAFAERIYSFTFAVQISKKGPVA